ncbi:hypothetical protein E2C01_022052 [Portunus trituberculatus]|uniref:Uncharacterized protein n=1 Tax=Portunus trituberculatus TaxID=210409 RepID=A0A5B7E479_PORTR|nr:hypothetical protein [Portunus trituberculatus]
MTRCHKEACPNVIVGSHTRSGTSVRLTESWTVKAKCGMSGRLTGQVSINYTCPFLFIKKLCSTPSYCINATTLLWLGYNELLEETPGHNAAKDIFHNPLYEFASSYN